jgi:hypothetical protein
MRVACSCSSNVVVGEEVAITYPDGLLTTLEYDIIIKSVEMDIVDVNVLDDSNPDGCALNLFPQL